MDSSRRPGPSVRVRVTELTAGGRTQHEDRVVTEEPLEIRLAEPGLAARRVNVTMRTPGHDFELAAGWLLHEGVLKTVDDVDRIAYCTDVDLKPEQQFNVVTVSLRRAALRALAERHTSVTAGSSACGVCGADSIEEVFGAVGDHARPAVGTAFSWSVLRLLPEAMSEQQRLFAVTGGLHAAALFTADGDLLVLREDVGRHNAVDKVSGARLLGAARPAAEVLVVSGRIGFEIVQKAVASGVSAVVAVGAPTSVAVDLARRAGLILVGFARGDRGVVYAGAEQLAD